MRDRVIFVEGAPRSGTTWLVTLLATHPEIAGVEAESHLFDFGVDRLFDNLEGRDPNFHGLMSYLDRDELVDLVRDLCDGVFMAMRSHVCPGPPPPFVVEKTPIASKIGGLDLARKRDCYPDGWYVHIVRDREAVARSLMRAPWMSDRSYEACAALWDRTVGHARAELGHLPRYREVSYEELRADPAQTCRDLFDWLGVDAGGDVLETVRVLSREPFSDLGAVAAASSRAHSIRSAVAGARAVLARQRNGRTEASGSDLPFRFARALRERDAETLRSLTAPSLELIYRSADEDLSLRGDDARAGLVGIADDTFARRYIGEWWGSPGEGPGEWWTSAPGKPLCTFMFSALGGDATRVDLAIGLVIEDGLIRRAILISAGALSGRPVVRASENETEIALVAGRT
ncbi:MAG: sulfotransferase family protein [Thermoleophilaceae bacterium]